MANKKAWAGRFEKCTHPVIEAFSESISFDWKLALVDIQGSIAHARMLADCGLISLHERDAIISGLEKIKEDYSSGILVPDPACEDVHMFIENVLTQRIGPVAGKLHTARSRNDQVATDLRLWCLNESATLNDRVLKLQELIFELSNRHIQTILPGYTHLQRAMPVTLAHHLLAYFWMLNRDIQRLRDWKTRAQFCPLGAAAIAGTSLPINREQTANELGFQAPIANSMDAVSDRDFAAELIFVCSLLMAHLSRLAEEIVIWNTTEFGFVTLDDSVATGSSIMPQKKNPDVAELIRGKTGRVFGDLVSLLTLIKGLPLTYMRDLQEDKPSVFHTMESAIVSTEAMTALLENCTFNVDRMREAAEDGFSLATDLAEYLVTQGVPFREAHEATGKLVKSCLDSGRSLFELTIEELAQAHPAFKEDAKSRLSVEASVNSRSHIGGTAPLAVQIQLMQAKQALEDMRRSDSSCIS